MATSGNDENASFHVDDDVLQAGLLHVKDAPLDKGLVAMLVIRPDIDHREVLSEVIADSDAGIVGDNWRRRGNARTPDGLANPGDQVTLMNLRAALLMAGSQERIPLAGDQIYVDLDIGVENLPPGTRLVLGEATLEITDVPHTGCEKFTARFGVAALRLTATPEGRALRLRGVNTRIISTGVIRVGDVISVDRP